MTWTAKGSLIQTIHLGTAGVAIAPVTAKDLIIAHVISRSTTVWVSALSASNIAWSLVGSKFIATNQGFTETTFFGEVLSISSATTTCTFTGGSDPGNTLLDGQEFASSIGTWVLDAQGGIDVASPGTLTFPSLTPGNPGELYSAFGYVLTTTAVAGSTSGFTYIVDSDGDGYCYNLNCSGAQTPVWGGTTGAGNGFELAQAVLVREQGLLLAVFPV